MDEHLTISVNFVNHVPVRDFIFEDPDASCGEFSVISFVDELWRRDKVDPSRLRFTTCRESDDTVVSLSAEVVHISGVYDLMMVGDGVREIERHYYGNAIETILCSVRLGIYLDDETYMYQIQENLDNLTEVVGSSAHGEMIRLKILSETIPLRETADQLALHTKIVAENSARGRKLSEIFFPAVSLPTDSILVVRADELKRFENAHLYENTPGIFDVMTPRSDLLEKGFVSVATAACLLADKWVDPNAEQPTFVGGQAHEFAAAVTASLNGLLRECVEGRIQAYAAADGMPMRHGESVVYDHTCLIRLERLREWCEVNGVSFAAQPSVDLSPNDPVGAGTSEEIVNEPSVPRVHWQQQLNTNFATIFELHGGRVTTPKVMKWLKANGGKRISTEGSSDELLWKDENGGWQVAKKKTVANIVSKEKRRHNSRLASQVPD